MRKTTAILGILLLLSLAGCTLFQEIGPAPVLTATANPDSGHPPFKTTITAVCSEEDGIYILAATEEDSMESNTGVFTVVIEDWPWKGVVTWTDGEGTVLEATVPLGLENKIPVAHSLWTVPRNYEDRALILIDLRYLEHGCVASTGKPEFVSGFEDPDYTGDGYSMENDGFTYHVEIEDMATGEFESVFYGPDRTLMGDEYVDTLIFYWFVNHTGEEPLYQYGVWSPLGCPYNPSPSPGEDEATAGKRVHIYVREWSEIRHWFYDITASEPRCAHVAP